MDVLYKVQVFNCLQPLNMYMFIYYWMYYLYKLIINSIKWKESPLPLHPLWSLSMLDTFCPRLPFPVPSSLTHPNLFSNSHGISEEKSPFSRCFSLDLNTFIFVCIISFLRVDFRIQVLFLLLKEAFCAEATDTPQLALHYIVRDRLKGAGHL